MKVEALGQLAGNGFAFAEKGQALVAELYVAELMRLVRAGKCRNNVAIEVIQGDDFVQPA